MNQIPVHVIRSVREAREVSLQGVRLTTGEVLDKVFFTFRLRLVNLVFSMSECFLFKPGIPKNIHHIIVFTSGILGDTIIMAGAVAALKKAYPESDITIITNCQGFSKGGSEILSSMPYVGSQIFIEDDYIVRRGIHFRIKNKKLKDLRCDLFVNLSPFGRRGWTGAVARELILAKLLKAKWATGFRVSSPLPSPRTIKIFHFFTVNEPRRSASVLKRIGLIPLTGSDAIPANIEKQATLLEKLKKMGIGPQDKFAVLNPGAKNESKCWPVEHFAETARWVKETYRLIPVLTGSPNEIARCQTVHDLSGGICLNLAGRTDLSELIELIRIATICISNDTGPMHISGCLDKPTIGIFAARWSAEFWYPQGSRSVVLYSKPPCALCMRDPFLEDENPVICLEAISLTSVQDAIKIAMSD